MGSRVKEDERIERAIRSLLKLPANRRCINCNSLGPQYVCATFWTFVCTNCSGIHREFTHRVKSISMAKFTTEEVNALKAGGNERAKKVYFKEWDIQRDAYPDGSNIFKLRDFIKNVYVEKRYCCESNDKINRHKLAIIEDSKETKNTNADNFRSRSSLSLDKSERSSTSGSSSTFGRNGNETLKFYFDDKKNKHFGQNSRSRGLPKSPIRFEIVDDRFRDDGSVKKYDGHSLPSRDSRRFTKSLDFSNNKDMPSSPSVRHTSEVLGDNAPRLLGNVLKKKDACEDTRHKQMTTSSSKKTLEEEMRNPRSLIDDVSIPEPSNPKSSSTCQTSNEVPVSLKKTDDPAPKSLEDLLFGLSVPSVETNNYELWSQSDISSTNNYPAANLGSHQMTSETSDRVTSFATSPTIAHNVGSSAPTFLVAADNTDITVYTNEMVAPSVAASNQVASTSPKGLSDAFVEQSTLDISRSALGECPGVGSVPYQNETSARRELPEDLFTGGFSFAFPQVQSWQTGQHHGMGYGMQYYQYPMAMGAITYKAKSTNPFDLSSDDTSPNQVPQYPAMAYMQGDLTHISIPKGSSDSSSPVALASHSPFYSSALSPSSPSPTLNPYPGAYIGQQSQVNMSQNLRRQGMDGVDIQGNNYNVADAFHQANIGYPSPNPNAYISRGNPFG